MTMKNDEKFKEEWTCRFETDTKNLANFDQSTILIKVQNV